MQRVETEFSEVATGEKQISTELIGIGQSIVVVIGSVYYEMHTSPINTLPLNLVEVIPVRI